jgi:hypothetical protein
LAALAAGFLDFVEAGRETLTSPRMDRPAVRAFDALTVGRVAGLLRCVVAMGTTLGET